jgi:hypothetical protein
MFRHFMKATIHRATVTHADLHYVGSLTISANLTTAVGLSPGEQVDLSFAARPVRLGYGLASDNHPCGFETPTQTVGNVNFVTAETEAPW